MLFTDKGAQKRRSSLGKGKIMRGFCMSLRFQFCPLHFDVPIQEEMTICRILIWSSAENLVWVYELIPRSECHYPRIVLYEEMAVRRLSPS